MTAKPGARLIRKGKRGSNQGSKILRHGKCVVCKEGASRERGLVYKCADAGCETASHLGCTPDSSTFTGAPYFRCQLHKHPVRRPGSR